MIMSSLVEAKAIRKISNWRRRTVFTARAEGGKASIINHSKAALPRFRVVFACSEAPREEKSLKTINLTYKLKPDNS